MKNRKRNKADNAKKEEKRGITKEIGKYTVWKDGVGTRSDKEDQNSTHRIRRGKKSFRRFKGGGGGVRINVSTGLSCTVPKNMVNTNLVR
jgi:hypothetical protein